MEWVDGTVDVIVFRGYQELGAWAEAYHGEYDGFRVKAKDDGGGDSA